MHDTVEIIRSWTRLDARKLLREGQCVAHGIQKTVGMVRDEEPPH